MRSKFLPVALFLSGLITQSAFAQSQSILPHVANGLFPGGSFRTTFVVVNNTDSTATAVLGLTKDNGDPLEVTIPELGTQSTFTLILAPGATRILQTDGSGRLVTGAATVTSNGSVGAFAVFTMLDLQGNFLTEAGVGDSPALLQFTLPVQVSRTFNTGIALYNPSTSVVTLSLRLLDGDGAVAGTTQLSLPPKSHTARFASELFPINNFIGGSIAVTGTGKIAALVLRQNTSSGTPTYTNLPVTSGASQGKVLPLLLPKTETGVAATSDVTLNATLPAGSKLTGKVSGVGFWWSYVLAQSGEDVFSGEVDSLTGKYAIAVPAGSYTLNTCYLKQLDPTGYVIETANGGSVQVSGDTTKDITLPGVNLFPVSGTVAGLDTLPTPSAMDSTGYRRIRFFSADNALMGYFPLQDNGTWQGMLPSGTFSAGIYVASDVFDSAATSISNIGSLTVSGGSAIGNFTVPPTAQISGRVTLAGNPAPAMDPLVFASDASAPRFSSTRCVVPAGTESIGGPDATGNYQMTLAKNRTYGVSVVANQWLAASVPVRFFPSAGNALNVTGDTTFDLMIPNLPGTVMLSGRVTDPRGQPVFPCKVSAFSDSITGAPEVIVTASGGTDPSGNYSITLRSGTNYRVTFVPPAPKLSAPEAGKP